VIVSGEISIKIEELGKVSIILLKRGESFVIRPGQKHEFTGIEDSQVIEEMYVEYSEEDIDRINIGSKI